MNNGKHNLGKFDAKIDGGIFFGYSQSSKAYRVYNKILFIIEESIHVTLDESYLKNVGKGVFFHDVDVSSQDILKEPEKGIDHPKVVEHEKEEDNDYEEEMVESLNAVDHLPLAWRTCKDHPIDNILEYILKAMTTCFNVSNFCYHFAFIS